RERSRRLARRNGALNHQKTSTAT
ncbi:hypothetical protein D046_5625E, partial [Vibrio parahaemolyticus V-223/04]